MSKLIKCTVCGKMVPETKQTCPKCGAWMIGNITESSTLDDEKLSLKPIIIPIIALIAVIATVMILPSPDHQRRAEKTGLNAGGRTIMDSDDVLLDEDTENLNETDSNKPEESENEVQE